MLDVDISVCAGNTATATVPTFNFSRALNRTSLFSASMTLSVDGVWTLKFSSDVSLDLGTRIRVTFGQNIRFAPSNTVYEFCVTQVEKSVTASSVTYSYNCVYSFWFDLKTSVNVQSAESALSSPSVYNLYGLSFGDNGWKNNDGAVWWSGKLDYKTTSAWDTLQELTPLICEPTVDSSILAWSFIPTLSVTNGDVIRNYKLLKISESQTYRAHFSVESNTPLIDVRTENGYNVGINYPLLSSGEWLSTPGEDFAWSFQGRENTGTYKFLTALGTSQQVMKAYRTQEFFKTNFENRAQVNRWVTVNQPRFGIVAKQFLFTYVVTGSLSINDNLMIGDKVSLLLLDKTSVNNTLTRTTETAYVLEIEADLLTSAIQYKVGKIRPRINVPLVEKSMV